MAAEYNQNQSSGLRSELDEPRRTTDQVKSDDFGTGAQEQRQSGGGYGGVTEDEPPHHRIHTDDEPLPKPAPGAYDEELPSSEPREEQVLPKPTGGEEYGDAPKNTEGYQEYRDAEPTKFDESPVETKPRGSGTGAEEATNGGYADSSSTFPDAPIDRKVEERGYGFDQKTSEPVHDSSEPALHSTTPETGTPKKEGLMAKIKDKLPGHHKSADTTDPDTTMEHDTTGAPPKKGLMTKIKDKLPGHHSSTTTE